MCNRSSWISFNLWFHLFKVNWRNFCDFDASLERVHWITAYTWMLVIVCNNKNKIRFNFTLHSTYRLIALTLFLFGLFRRFIWCINFMFEALFGLFDAPFRYYYKSPFNITSLALFTASWLEGVNTQKKSCFHLLPVECGRTLYKKYFSTRNPFMVSIRNWTLNHNFNNLIDHFRDETFFQGTASPDMCMKFI